MANVHELISEEVFRICFFLLSFNLLLCCFLVSELLFIIQRFLAGKESFQLHYLLIFQPSELISSDRNQNQAFVAFAALNQRRNLQSLLFSFFFFFLKTIIKMTTSCSELHILPLSSQYTKANLGWGINSHSQCHEFKGFNFSLHITLQERILAIRTQ